MKKIYEIYLFIALQIILTLLYIYKESTYIGAFYQHQKIEKKLTESESELKNLTQQLQELKNRSAIQHYAQSIGLEPLSLEDVRHADAQQSS